VQKMIEALKKGDHVITTGGLFGDVVDVHEDRVIVRVAENVKVEVAKSAVSGVIPPQVKGKGGKES
jgi:preprotein translocase subunit YajC